MISKEFDLASNSPRSDGWRDRPNFGIQLPAFGRG
jgi:hypothetical protein